MSILAREPISRILSWEIIYLCSQPEGSGGQPSSAFLLGLAPARVYRAAPVAQDAGGLLHHRFTLARRVSPGGLFSVALSLGFPPLGFPQWPALRSPDFPQRERRPLRDLLALSPDR